MPELPTRVARASTFSVVSIALLLMSMATTLHAQLPENPTSTRAFLDEMDAYYLERFPDRSPETIRGSGYKPFMRYKWLMDRRLGDLENLPPRARWDAWERLEEIRATQDRGALPTWFPLGPINVAGRCLAIEVDPTNSDIVYAGFASGGLWKSLNGGTTWTPLGDDLPTLAVGAIEIDVTNPDRIWMGTGEGWGNSDAVHGVGVLVSTDAGVTWNSTGYSASPADGRDVFEIEYNPTTGTLMIGADNGLFRSTDGGDTFDEVMPSGSWKDIELRRGSTDTYYACSHGWTPSGFYTSTDDGLTWSLTTAGTPTSLIGNCRFALTDADPDVIYWTVMNVATGKTLGIYRSTDGGQSFDLRTTQNHFGTGGQGWYNLTLSVDPSDPDKVFSGGVKFYRSTDGALGFFEFASNVHVDHHATHWDPSDPSIFWVGSDGGVWRSTNAGDTFSDRNTGLVTLQLYAMNHSWPNPNLALGGTQDNGTWRYNGNTIFTKLLFADGFECEAGYSDPDLMFAEIQFGDHYRSTNGGASMVPINNGIVDDGPWQTPTHMDYSNENILWTAHNTRIYRTTNAGTFWSTVHNPVSMGSTPRSIDQSLNNPDRVVCVTAFKCWVSDDHGVNWHEEFLDVPHGLALTDVAVHPDDPDIFLITMGTYNSNVPRVAKTTNGGGTWTDITGDLPGEAAQSITFDIDNPDFYYLATDLAIYASFDAGVTWEPFDVGLPNVVCDDIRFHPDRLLRVATHGRGMWELDLSGFVPASIEDGPGVGDAVEETVQPLTLRVLGNPAAGSTSIRFGLRTAGHLRLGLYDISGREVRTILDEEHGAFVAHIDVDLSDLPVGVYLVRLDANGASTSEKIVIRR